MFKKEKANLKAEFGTTLLPPMTIMNGDRGIYYLQKALPRWWLTISGLSLMIASAGMTAVVVSANWNNPDYPIFNIIATFFLLVSMIPLLFIQLLMRRERKKCEKERTSEKK
jgi:hypothetical protein